MAQCRTSPRIAENPVGLSSTVTSGDISHRTALNPRPVEIRHCRQINSKNFRSVVRSIRGKRRSLQSPTAKLTGINSKTKTNVVKGASAASATIMKTKQKEDKIEDEPAPESSGKTRARKKICLDDDKNKVSQDPDTDKTTTGKEQSTKKKIVKKAPVIAKKRPLGVTKTLRSKKIIAKDSVKKIIKQVGNKRGRKPKRKVTENKTEAKDVEEKDLRIIPASEIKKEPLDDTPATNSRSSSPKVSGVRRQRLTSDFEMMKSVLGDSPTSILLGSRTSPYSMRSERSNSPFRSDSKNLRSLSQRKLKNNLLNEIVKNEQKKRRLVSDSKAGDVSLDGDESKKLKRGRSFSRDGSEISKCSDVTDTDSLCETLSSDADGKLDEIKKSSKDLKTELDLDIEDTSLPSPTDTDKVPSSTVECNPDNAETRSSLSLIDKPTNKIQSLKRSTSLDSDNNNKMKLTNIQNTNIESEDKSEIDKTENKILLADRSVILNNMSKTFNTKEMSKNIRKARRGRKTTSTPRDKKCELLPCNKPLEDRRNSLTKEINELIETLEMCEAQEALEKSATKADDVEPKISSPDANIKSAPKFYSLADPTNLKTSQNIPVDSAKTSFIDQNQIKSLEKDVAQDIEATVKKLDDSENIRLRIDDEDSRDKLEDSLKENVKTTFKPSTQDIDKLMDKLKHFEELDKKRQQELKAKSSESVMVTNDVVLIPKSGAEIKPLKDIQATMTAAKPMDKGSVLSCFQNNAAISIVKRDHARKSVDIDLPNSITLIKRNPSSRKESTGSNSGDTISIIEKSLGKDVTLTELRRSIDKSPISPLSVDQYATIQPNKPGTAPQSIATIVSNKSQTDKNEPVKKEITGSINGNENSKMFVVPRRYTAYTPKPENEEEIINSPSLAVNQVLLPKGEIMKSPLQTVKLPISEIQSVQPTVATSKKLVTSRRSTTHVPKSDLDDEIISPPLIIDQDLSPKSEILKLPLQTVNSPMSEIKFVQPLADASNNILVESLTPIAKPIQGTMQSDIAISADLPKNIIINSNKSISSPSIVTATLSNVKSTPKDELVAASVINITSSVTAQEQKEVMSSPTPILVSIPPCEPKVTVMSPRSEEKTLEPNTKSPQKVSTSPKETAKLPSPSKTSPKVEATTMKCPSPVKALPKVETTTAKFPSLVKASPEVEALINFPSPTNSLLKIEATSIEAVPGPSIILIETPESQKRKENILRTLGLLTLKAADEAKIEKQKQKEMRELASKNSQSKGKASSGGESSGTLKTVIKLNRGLNQDKKNKNRSSLKMTFQKSKGRAGKPSPEDAGSGSEEYYTIHKEGGMATGAAENAMEGIGPEQPTKSPEPLPGKEDSLNLVIPEKASSFSIHPGRLCQDQCFYCGGKFGLFDTPCHIAQMKSSERQKKVLDNEEKLTIDSCLCDACYRHVDRRANCPSYRKRPNFISKPSTGQLVSPTSSDIAKDTNDSGELPKAGGRPSVCHAVGCNETAEHSIRRKWLIKMRNSVSKVVKLDMDYPGLHTIPLCGAHYKPVSLLMVCGLCRRRLNKHHNIHYISQGYQELNPLLEAQGVPVRFTERPVVCKLCRYFCTLLFRPKQQLNKKHFLKLHRRRLLLTYNIELPEEPEVETAEESKDDKEGDASAIKQKKKNKTGKSKQRKSVDSVKHNEDSTESLEKDANTMAPTSEKNTSEPMEEDIESLISTNKIAKAPGEANIPSDNSDADTIIDFEATLVPSFDKQTELQYLLQKQNNPAQFLQKPIANLTQKQRAVLKAHNASPIQKPAAQVKVHEKNAKRIQKLGQIITQKEPGKTPKKDEEAPVVEDEKSNDSSSVSIIRNISLNDECTIESIPIKKTADISILKNKWQMSESFSQVKKNLSELSKNVTVEKPKKSTDSKYSNPVRRLETNPSISVRELFPGEEEMNLQCSIEFNNVKGATPEGWEKCHSTIQYDVETKKLWNELQKPYGNQSSFLRHLVLLEKYFRSGDLVLAQNANGHATNYNDSVQSRLRAYDNVPEPPKRTQPAVSLIEFRRQKPNAGKSLLKSNQSIDIIPKSTEMKAPLSAPKQPEPSVSGLTKVSKGNFASFLPTAMPAPAVFAKPRPSRPVLPPSSIAITPVEMRPSASKSRPTLPPELISIHTPTTQGRKSIENVLKNIQQLVKGVSAPPEPMEIIPIPAPAPTPPQVQPPPPPPPPKPEQFVKKHKQRTTTKPWRPTLMQITQENIARIAREPTQIAVDGRSLPSLVQVMSGGQRYHITLADYNKMCIMRREKLQQIQVVENSAKSKKPTTELVTEIQTSTTLGNGGTLTQNVTLPHSDNHKDTSDTPSTSFVQPKSEISEASRAESNAANILKNVGLKNITIAAVTERPRPTATVTSNSLLSPAVTSSSLVITSTPIKMPQLGPSVSITSDALISPGISSGLTISASAILSSYGATIQPLVMPKIPKSLTVIPQTVPITSTIVNVPTSMVNSASTIVNMPSSVMSVQPSIINVPSKIVNVPSTIVNVPSSTIVVPSFPTITTTGVSQP